MPTPPTPSPPSPASKVQEPIPALVLAGGKASPEFAQLSGTEFRALAELNGRPMVAYVLQALREASTISRVVLVAPSGVPDLPEAEARVVGDGDLVDNILAGAAACPGAGHVLLITADIPFIRPEEVDDYVRTSLAGDADACYAAVSIEACRRQFPGMKRTALRTPAGLVTGGNLVVQRVSALPQEAAFIRRAYAERKSPLGLARIIGFGNVLKFLLGRLTLKDIETAASRVLGVRCRLLLTPHAALGTDIDRPEDLLKARALFAERGSVTRR
jgi:molybdopterin-guanine dinucleotide biosynthesis protein A